MTAAPKLAEKDLGPPLQAWLEAEGWIVYQEVKFRSPDGSIWIADMVIAKGSRVGVVEMKTTLGLEVMAQAQRWRRHAHRIYIAVPAEKGRVDAPSSARQLAYQVLEGLGIGVRPVRPVTKLEQLAAMRPGIEAPALADRVAVAVEPGEQRADDAGELLAALEPEHQTFSEAGTKNGRRWTPAEKAYPQIREALADLDGAAALDDVALATGIDARLVTRWGIERRIEGVRLDASGAVVMLRRVHPGEEAPILSRRSAKSRPARRVFS